MMIEEACPECNSAMRKMVTEYSTMYKCNRCQRKFKRVFRGYIVPVELSLNYSQYKPWLIEKGLWKEDI